MSGAHRFVFDGGTGHTQVQLAVLLDAGVDQGLDRSLFLEEQEGIAWRKGQTNTNIRICVGPIVTLGLLMVSECT